MKIQATIPEKDQPDCTYRLYPAIKERTKEKEKKINPKNKPKEK